MEIFTKKNSRGDGEFEMTFAKRIDKDGAPKDELLISTVIQFLATDELQENYLIAVAGDKVPRLEVINKKTLKSKNDFAGMLRPYSFFGGTLSYEFLLNFWKVNSKKNTLVYLKDILGRYTDETVELWILDQEVIIQRIKDEKLSIEVSGGDVTVEQNAFDLLSIKHNHSVNFKIGDKWYWIDNADVAIDLRPMNRGGGSTERLEVKEYLKMWGDQYGNKVMNYCVLGWFISLMFREEMVEARGASFFPYFSLTGLTQAGKTALVGNLMKFWGMDAKALDWTQTSPFVEVKHLSQLSSVPIWRDEYREGVGYSKMKEPILRSLYNMAPLPKGTKDQGLLNYESRTSLLLSGEDAIQDPATRRRAIYFGLADEWKVGYDEWEKVIWDSSEYFCHLFFIVLKIGFDKKKFREVYKYALAELKSINDKGEEGVCYAALGAVFGVEFGKAMVDNANKYWNREKIMRPSLVKRDDLFEQFWDCAEVFFDQINAYEVKEIYGEMIKPKILDFITYKEKTNSFVVNAKYLLREVYGRGRFTDYTTINAAACESMLVNKLRSRINRQDIDGKKMRVFELYKLNSSVTPNLKSILENVQKTYDIWSKWRISKFKAIEDGDYESEDEKPIPLPEFTLEL